MKEILLALARNLKGPELVAVITILSQSALAYFAPIDTFGVAVAGGLFTYTGIVTIILVVGSFILRGIALFTRSK